MTSFRDSKSRCWDVSLNVQTAKRVRDRCDVNLLKILDEPELLTNLAADPITFVDVLWVMIEPQAIEKGVTDEQFGESLAGESIDLATEAFLAALVDFFPGARKATLQRVLARATKQIDAQEAAMQKMIDNGTLDKALDEVMTPSTTSTESPVPPELTPTL